ncbi:hypothetical protein G7054_g12058 [Neopestalotiopsis clavispora]|nr:hypothetical protein G7054_g12058 [Neopestalotiopsis clavispora]
MNAAPISSPIGRHGSVSAASSTASQSSPSQQMFVPPQQPPQRQQQQAGGTDAFLRDFNLVAEAAKRAQMAVLMRDFESCGLS